MTDDLVATPVPEPAAPALSPPPFFQTALPLDASWLPTSPLAWVVGVATGLAALVLFLRMLVKCMGWDQPADRRKKRR